MEQVVKSIPTIPTMLTMTTNSTMATTPTITTMFRSETWIKLFPLKLLWDADPTLVDQVLYVVPKNTKTFPWIQLISSEWINN